MAAEKNREGGLILFLFFTESHLVGARNKYAQTRSTVVWYNIFKAITFFSNITIYKRAVSLHTCVSVVNI